MSEHLLGTADVQYARGVPDSRQVADATSFMTAANDGHPGVNVETFENTELNGVHSMRRVPRINQGAPLDFGPFAAGEIDLDVAALAQSRRMSTRWTGYYTPERVGAHDVIVHVGGFSRVFGYRLYVDDVLVADRWTMKLAALDRVRLALDASAHKVVLEHRTEAGGLDGPVPFVRLGIMHADRWVDETALALAKRADAVILAVGFDAASETEDWDRTFSLPAGQDELIRSVTAENKNTIVVITAGGAVDMSGWLDRTPSVLQAWYLGQEGAARWQRCCSVQSRHRATCRPHSSDAGRTILFTTATTHRPTRIGRATRKVYSWDAAAMNIAA